MRRSFELASRARLTALESLEVADHARKFTACGAVLLAAVAIVGIRSAPRSDVRLYHRYGDAIASGAVPYRDVAIEYPPGALPFFVAPALITNSSRSYDVAFVASMVLAALLLVGLTARLVQRLGRESSALHAIAVTALIASLGGLAVNHFDLVPAALTVGALLALGQGRHRLAGVALGAAVAVKVYPLVLVPLAAIYVARRAGRAAAAGMTALTIAVVTAAYLPFILMSASGVRASLDAQLFRPLEVESLGGALYAAVYRAFGLRLPEQTAYQHFNGHSADVVGYLSAAIGLLILAALWVAYARGPATLPSLVRYSAASVAAFMVFAKVFSPQYLLWLIPLVVAVRGRRGWLGTALLALACVLTAAVVRPHTFDALRHQLAAGPLGMIIVRDLLILLTIAVLSSNAAVERPLADGPTHVLNG
ncbi:MAG: DUF2029 domain-containing protein [Actinobacteria bacterium]|nr:MAG: DUF2029 domain-containing protein [Actinomycetota bacterium]